MLLVVSLHSKLYFSLRGRMDGPNYSFCPGACGGELACSTCHLVFEKEIYDTLSPKKEEEDDMLDLAFEVTET